MTDPALVEDMSTTPTIPAVAAPTDAEQQAVPNEDNRDKELAQALRREQFYASLKGGNGLNPMVNACSDLFATLMRIHATTEAELAEMDMLYHHANEELFALNTTLQQTDLYDEVMIASCRYSLCIMLDEAALQKLAMQQSQSEWAKQPLTQLHYHQKPSDDKLDAVITRLLMNPTKYRAVIEVIYQGLLLGYKGIHSYGLDQAGHSKRKTAIKDIQRFLTTHWSQPKQQLTEPYYYHRKQRYEIKKDYSPWIIYSVTLLAICLIYWFFDYLLDADTQEVLQQLQQLGSEKG